MFDQRFTWANVRQLARAPVLSRLRGLYLGSSGFGDEAVVELFSSPHLSNLQEVNLARSPVGDAGLLAIAAADMPALLGSDQRPRRGARAGGAGVLALPPEPQRIVRREPDRRPARSGSHRLGPGAALEVPRL